MTPAKSLRNALLECDEDKAMLIYTTPNKGKSLQEDLHPSDAFASNKMLQTSTIIVHCHHVALQHIAIIMGLVFRKHIDE